MTSGYEKAAQLKYSFLTFAALFSFLVLGIASFFVDFQVSLAIFAGLLIGVLDNFIMFLGIQNSTLKEPDKAFANMKKNMLKRIIFVALACFVAIKLGIEMLMLFIAFLSTHLMCLVFVIFYAKGRLPKGRKE